MKTLKLSGAALAIGAAAMLSMAPTFAADAIDAPLVHCKGVNSCKAQGSCKTANNTCKGQNSCKGTGVMQMTKEDCMKAGGTMDMDTDTDTDAAKSTEE